MTLYALGADAPQLHADTWVAPDANLIGKVVMEEGSSVWFGCTIRADHEVILIGAGSLASPWLMVPSLSCPRNTFMPGLPMKPATKRLFGLS